MEVRKVKILGTGTYLPKKVVYSKDIDKKIDKPIGWVEKKAGIKKRFFVEKETLSEMGASAALEAIHNARIEKEEIDCIFFASASKEQLIPNMAAILQKKLGLQNSKIPTFDINTVCLSFVSALDLASCLIHAGKYKNALIVSSEIASLGLNWDDFETCTIFGDGAAAAVIGKTDDIEKSQIFASHMETFSEGIKYAELRGGGTRCYPTKNISIRKEDYCFQMKGRRSFKLVAEKMPDFMGKLLEKSNKKIEKIDLIIPHQASYLALKHLRKRLNIPVEKWMDIFSSYGNQISVSIPNAIHQAVISEKIKRGSTVLLLGSSAGISLGGIILEY